MVKTGRMWCAPSEAEMTSTPHEVIFRMLKKKHPMQKDGVKGPNSAMQCS